MDLLLEEIFHSGQVKSSRGEITQLHSHIPREAGEFLQEIISELKPKVSLEVGLAFGISALFICEELMKLPQSLHIAIDPYQELGYQGIGLDNLERAGYSKIVEFYQQPSYSILPTLEQQGLKIDFAFIDGSHFFDYALVDFFYIDKLLRVGGVVVFDDTNFLSIQKICKFIVKNRFYSVYKCMTTTKEFQHSLPKLVKLGIEKGRIPNLRCIAFKKEIEDNRSDNFYKDF